jgi:hypothetical protein
MKKNIKGQTEPKTTKKILNNIITPEIKAAFTAKFPHLSGKATRKILRNMVKSYINPVGNGKLKNDNGIRKSRKERRQLAKKLKVPFEARYNGPVFVTKHENVTITTKKGKEKEIQVKTYHEVN